MLRRDALKSIGGGALALLAPLGPLAGIVRQPATAIDLLQFCDFMPGRLATAEPWIRAGWRYATDSRVIVRVPAEICDSANEGAPPAEKAFTHFAGNGPWLPWPGRGPLEIGECPECSGRGFVKQPDCPACDGAGTFDDSEGWSERLPVECKRCQGWGGVGGTVCPHCHGAHGEPLLIYQPIGPEWIAGHYDRRIRTLPGVRYRLAVPLTADRRPHVADQVIEFRFAGGGQGLVAPVDRS